MGLQTPNTGKHSSTLSKEGRLMALAALLRSFQAAIKSLLGKHSRLAFVLPLVEQKKRMSMQLGQVPVWVLQDLQTP